jgi:hypothetical protein
MNKIRRAWLLFGLVAVAVLALGGFAQAPPASAAVNGISIVPATQTVPPGATEITLSLELDATAPGIGGWDIDVVYDDVLLRVTACSPTAGGFCSVLAEPIVNFDGKSAAGLTGSPLQLGTITFEAADTGGRSAIDPFILELRDPNGSDITFTSPTGGEVVIQEPGLSGDVDCGETVNSVDALKLLRHNAGLPVQQTEPCLDIGSPLASGFNKGDVSCSQGVNAVDALLILRTVADLPVGLPPGCPAIGGDQP